jgi:glutamate/tyrosine decarboxylase-like PLP-dependent enzyme
MNPLRLDRDTMRTMGYQAVDAMVDQVDSIQGGETPALTRATPDEMAARLPYGVPDGPRGFEDLLAQLQKDVFPYMGHMDHPGYLAFIPSSGTFPGALGDFMASALNVYVGSWMEGAGPSRLELVVIDWFKRWIGYPAEAAGTLVTGGSAANITALACAREALLGAMNDRVVAYVSDQGHSSLARAARLLGFRPDQVRVLPTDSSYRLTPETLAAAIDADVEAGRRPLFAGVNAGSTNTGAIDPLTELAAVCRERGVWLHADAAYGGFAALTERGREQLAGLELTDSVTLDPHKWLYQSYECGAVLVRQGDLLRNAFEIVPDYLSESVAGDGEVSFGNLGLQLSRTSRALKVWLSVSYFGVDAFRDAMDRALDLAVLAQRRIESLPQLELTSAPSLGILSFRRRGPAGAPESEIARINAALVRGFEATGAGLVSSTRLRGRFTVRLCCMNHTTRAEDVERILDYFAHTDPATLPMPQPRTRVLREVGLEGGWLSDPAIAWHELCDVPLFGSLGSEDLKRIASWAREQLVDPGEVAVKRWDGARDFYVVLSGSAEVSRDGACVASLVRGDFFGELAALDWGAGYGYARSATVTATAPLRLLVLSPTSLEHVMRLSPEIVEQLDSAMRRHLAAS